MTEPFRTRLLNALAGHWGRPEANRPRGAWREPVMTVPGVPAWFTRLLHVMVAKTLCRRGHVAEARGCCGRCGGVLDADLCRAAGVAFRPDRERR